MQMNILETLIQLRDDIKTWVTNNLVALDNKIESKTIQIDNELKTDSTNPVQNKIIKAKTDELANAISALDNVIETIQNNIDNITDDGSGEFNIADPNGNVIFKIDANGAHTTKLELSTGDIDTQLDTIENEIARVASEAFSGDYNDLTNKPNLRDDESGEYIIVDEVGNIIFKVDANGAHTTEISLGSTKVKETLETLSENIDNINEVAIPGVVNDLAAHKADTNNPHEVAFKQLKDNNIEDDESGEVVYADSNGNIIAKIDANGLKTTEISLGETKVKETLETLSENIDSISTNIDTTNTRIDTANTRIDNANTRIDTVNSSIDTTNDRIDTANNRINAANSRIDALNSSKANTADLADVATTGDYEDLNNAPTITNDKSAELNIVDNDENIVAKIDENGIHSTSLTLKNPLNAENGGTGNTIGRVQIGQKAEENLGINATSEGNDTIASGNYSHAEGRNTKASGNASHAEGGQPGATDVGGGITLPDGTAVSVFMTEAGGDSSHAEGYPTRAEGKCTHSEGSITVAHGDYSHAEGYYSVSYGEASHAEGNNTIAWGNYSHAEGVNTTAPGGYSHAEGNHTTAWGDCSHTEGMHTTAPGECSHAEGINTTASGHASHAEGMYATASGGYSHAEGMDTTAFEYASHAEGIETIAIGAGSHSEGGSLIVGEITLSGEANATTYDIITHNSELYQIDSKSIYFFI